MAERAHPEHPGFQSRRRLRFKRVGIFPWFSIQRNPYRQAFFARYKWVNKFCGNRSVLDIPCGMGWGTSLLTNGRARTGVDLAEDAIAEARERYGDVAKFLVANMTRLSFQPNTFDIVACLEGIEHIEQAAAQQFVKEAARVLSPGGLLFLTSPNNADGVHSGNPFHFKEYNMSELQGLVEPYFHVTDLFTKSFETGDIIYLCATKRS